MARGKAHSAETKAAVIGALLAGQGVNEVAAQFGLNSGLVSRWKATIPQDKLQQVAAQKKERLVDLIEAHLTASLKGAAKCAGQANDDVWRSRQSAENLAVFYGVLSDKAFRLVEVAGRVFSDEQKPS
jgi:transposase-like protein